jgi:hypothetical protein
MVHVVNLTYKESEQSLHDVNGDFPFQDEEN